MVEVNEVGESSIEAAQIETKTRGIADMFWNIISAKYYSAHAWAWVRRVGKNEKYEPCLGNF